MVKDSILQIIYSSLINYLNEDDVNYIFDYNRYKYILRLNDFSIEIVFYFTDNYYTVKLENWHNNFLNNVTQLSKCKEFKKAIKNTIKQQEMKYNLFQSHILAIIFLIKKEMDKKNSLLEFEKLYTSNLKFDGIFI